MKRMFVIAFAMFMCCAGYARKVGAPDIRAKYMLATEATGSNAFEVTGAYLFNIGGRFHLEAGVGFGTANPMIWQNPNTEEYEKSNSFTAPVFVRGKFDFKGERHRPFISATATGRYAVVSYDNKDFNPMAFSINAAFGYEWRVGTHWIGFEAGFEPMFGKYVNTFNSTGYENGAWLDISVAVHFTF